MGIITIFLIVIITALGFGNALLSLTGRKEKTGGFVLIQPEGGREIESIISGSQALANKVDMAHSRLNGIENMLSSGKYLFSAGMEHKVRNFDHFRANTQVEMQAIKEILLELQKNHITAKSKVYSPRAKTNGEDAQKMHSLIYRSRIAQSKPVVAASKAVSAKNKKRKK